YGGTTPRCRRSRSTRRCATRTSGVSPSTATTGTGSACRWSTDERVHDRARRGSAVSWLADPALARIWQVLRRRLEDRGLRAAGRVVLTGLSREERHAASALVGRPVTSARL